MGTTTIHDPSSQASEIFTASERQQAGTLLAPRIFSTGEIVYGAKAAGIYAQIDSLVVLLDDLCKRFGIPRSQVIAHADMAPTRKRDPGARFPWATLHAAGFGRWPTGVLEAPPPGFDPWLAMAAIGYPLKDRAAAVRAFHRHFRGRDDGEDAGAAFDAEDLRILHALSKP